ncbi:BrnT family toxin [Aeromonas salmonicida]|uniref:BrnT family toxin n=1 Tax=Aeromonas salmonicida TaxID=645 RepID=UPI00240E2D12|nr:BrnT family toxin [Aeromonas salmonicida]MDM5149250.1 BrnT family toxin [Aeromonas salmonicida]WFC12862.1 BrnT family toxin [Aeromonas salmonicida]
MDIYPRVPESVSKRLCELNINRDSERLKLLKLPHERLVDLLQVLDGSKKIDYFYKLDIQLYVWKKLFQDVEADSFISAHIYSKGDSREYDPAKNGQNIIKHGISFGEVTSYSKRFGTLSIPCPDEDDETRYVIFSDLAPGLNGENLCLPIPSTIQEPEVYTLSVVQILDLKPRFISSRIMSRKKFSKNMKNAFKGIYDDDPIKKKDFVSECVHILRRDLFKRKT